MESWTCVALNAASRGLFKEVWDVLGANLTIGGR